MRFEITGKDIDDEIKKIEFLVKEYDIEGHIGYGQDNKLYFWVDKLTKKKYAQTIDSPSCTITTYV